jgi:hypothetical protein
VSLVRDAARSRSCGFLESLCRQRRQQDQDGFAAGLRWQEHSPAFASKAHRSPFARPPKVPASHPRAAGFAPDVWTPSKLRHTAASSLALVPRTAVYRWPGPPAWSGHSSTAVTELIYRKQIRPVLQGGKTAMDRIFNG